MSNSIKFTREDIEKLVEVENNLKTLLVSDYVERNTMVHIGILKSLNILSKEINSLVKRMKEEDEGVYLCHIESSSNGSRGFVATLYRDKFNNVNDVLEEMKQRKYNGEFIEDNNGNKLDIDLSGYCIN